MTEDTAQCRGLASSFNVCCFRFNSQHHEEDKPPTQNHKCTAGASDEAATLESVTRNVPTGKHGPVCLRSLTIHQAWVICTFTYLSDMGKMLIFILQRSLMS